MDLPMLSNEEHAQSVSAEGLVVVRSLDWSNVHADVCVKLCRVFSRLVLVHLEPIFLMSARVVTHLLARFSNPGRQACCTKRVFCFVPGYEMPSLARRPECTHWDHTHDCG